MEALMHAKYGSLVVAASLIVCSADAATAADNIGVTATVITLLFVGFAVYGAQVLLVGTAPVDLARAGTAAAAVGFVNCVGYMGAFAGDVVTGSLVDAYGWEVGVYFWSGCAFAAAVFVALLWKVRAPQETNA